MLSIFKKKKSLDSKPLEEIVVVKKNKSSVAEMMNTGSFIGKYERVEKMHFTDVTISEYNEPTYNYPLTDEDVIISKKSGGLSYSDYIAENIKLVGQLGTNGPICGKQNESLYSPYSNLPTVMFETDEIINDPNLVSIGRSIVTGQHVYKYLGDNAMTLNNIGIGWNELI